MKILVLTHHDATNLSIVNILKELKRRGHEIEIFAQFMDHKSIRMFNELNNEIRSINELNDEIIDKCDIIFCALNVVFKVINANKFIFCYNFLFMGFLPSDGGDLMFTQSDNRDLDYYEDCITIPIGNPRYDSYEYNPISYNNMNSNKILLIESGHYPFGKEGRRILANLILNICNNYKEYELWIKPRFLIGDKNFTHRNEDHIYNFILKECKGELPSNLILLQEHLNLEELVKQSKTVITMYTAAYLDVAVSKKGIIVIEGLPNEDIFDIRNDYMYKKYNSLILESGCLVNYKDVLSYLPNGIRCNDNHIKKNLCYLNNASGKIVDVIEYVWDRFLKIGEFPCIKQYNFETFKNDMHIDHNITWEKIKAKRIKNHFLSDTRIFHFIKTNIDYSKYIEVLEEYEKRGLLTNENFNYLNKKMELVRNEIFISNKENMMKDEIDQSFLFLAMEYCGLINELMNFKEDVILCKGTYYFLKGKNAFDNKEYLKCIKQFKNYFEDTNKRLYDKFVTDNSDHKSIALLLMSKSFMELDKDDKAILYLKKCREIINENNSEINRDIKLYWYIKARKKLDNREYKYAIDLFKLFLKELDIEKEANDNEIKSYILSAYFYTGRSYMEIKQNKNAVENFKLCCELTNNNHKEAAKYIELIESE